MADRSVIVDLIAHDLMSPVLAKAGATADATGAKVEKMGRLSKAALMLGATAVIGLGVETVKMASQFEASMALIHTQAGVPQSAIAGLSDGVLKLSGQVAQNPDSLAEALYHIESSFASTGITGTKALDLLKTAAEGATIGHANLVDVTNALDAAVVAGIPGVENLNQAMGVLNATVGAGDMSMQDLSDAFGTGAVAAVKGYGLSILDVGAALATFGDNNIRGADAGTALRVAVQALAVPAKTADAELKALGMTSKTLADDMQTGGLNKALTDLKTRMDAAGISAEQQGQVITDLFGKKAGTGINILLGQFDRLQSKYVDLQKGANNFGDAWASTQQTFSFQMRALGDATQAFMIRLGTGLLPVAGDVLSIFTAIMPVLGGIAGAFTALPEPVRMTAVGLVAVGVAVKLLSPAFAAVGSSLSTAGGQFTGFLTRIRQAETVTGGLKVGVSGVVGMLGGPWTLAITAAVGLLGWWSSHTQSQKAATDSLTAALEQSNGAIDDNVRKTAAKSLVDSGAASAAQKLGLNLADVTNAMLGNRDAQEVVNATLDRYKGQLTTSVHGPMTEAQRKYGEMKMAADQVSAAIGDASSAVQQQGVAQSETNAAVGTGTTKAQQLAKAEQDVSQALSDLDKALDSTKNAMMGQMGAEDSYASALIATRTALKENGRTLDLSTQKGVANRDALLAQARAALELDAKMKANGATAGELTAKVNEQRGAFVKAATQMGMTKGEADKLANSFFGAAQDAAQAASKANALKNALAGITSKSVTVTTTFIQNQQSVYNQQVPKHSAAGGPLAAGELTQINEMGMEFFRPNVSGTVIPIGAGGSMRDTGGGAPTFVFQIGAAVVDKVGFARAAAEAFAYARKMGWQPPAASGLA